MPVVDLGVDLGDWPMQRAFDIDGWRWQLMTVVILDLVSERSERRVSGIHAVTGGDKALSSRTPRRVAADR